MYGLFFFGVHCHCFTLFFLIPFFFLDAFDSLDAPMERVTGADVPMPYSTPIENLAMVQTDNVISAVKRVCYPHGSQ